ncbi:MAG: efflux transporter outer membrane subunit [Desulfovibrionaceae bacterium]
MPERNNINAGCKARVIASARPFLAALLLFAASAMVAGCMVGPNYKKPTLDIPNKWEGNATDNETALPNLEEWWRNLDDPLLNQLIDEAVKGNLDVAGAKARIREARASYRKAGGTLWPSLDANALAMRNGYGSTSSSAEATHVPDQYSLYKAGFDASWELDLFGGNRRALEAAEYGLNAAQEDLRSTLLTLIGDVASYYAQARGYQVRIKLARNTAASQEKTANMTRARFESGSASGVDLSEAVATVRITEANIPSLQAAFAEAVHRLGILLGEPPTTLTAKLSKPADVPVPQQDLPEGVPADVLLNRPDVQLAERRLAQYTARIGEAQAARFPKINLVGSLDTSVTDFGDLARKSSVVWSFGPTLSVPVFNAGQLKAAVEVAQAQRDQYFLAYQSSVLTALEDVENALVSLAKERKRATILTEAVTNYREAAELSQMLYEAGSTSYLDVLVVQRALYSAEDSLAQSQTRETTYYVALAKALGGGWSKPVDAGEPLIEDDMGPHFALPYSRDDTGREKEVSEAK